MPKFGSEGQAPGQIIMPRKRGHAKGPSEVRQSCSGGYVKVYSLDEKGNHVNVVQGAPIPARIEHQGINEPDELLGIDMDQDSPGGDWNVFYTPDEMWGN